MRRFIKIFVIVVVLFVIGYFGYKIVRKIQLQKQVAIITATIPQFSFQTIANQNYSKQNIKDTMGNVVIQLFSPDCVHCQYMAQSFVKNKDKLKNTEIIMVTPFGDSSAVAQFAQTYGLNTLPNVQLLLDKRYTFFRIFGTSLVPSFFVYKNNRLVKSIKGETKMENLIN